VSLSLFFGVLTFAPAVAALLLAGLGLARRLTERMALILTSIGMLLPLVALIYLVADLRSGLAQKVTLVGPGGPGTWLSLALRFESYAVYAAFGVMVVVTPLLLWMAWRGIDASGTGPEAGDVDDDLAGSEAGAEEPAEGRDEEASASPWLRQRGAGSSRLLARDGWTSVALVLGLESALLVLCFADTIVWLALAWIALAALAWGVGEVGAELGDLDYRSLALMVAGPVLWLVVMLLIAAPMGAARISDLAGVGGASIWLVLLVCVFLALAGGAYPFNGWVRRRAIVTPPVGFAAVVLAALPAALFVAGRTYGALQDSGNLWPQLGAATPPITIGIALVLLGAVTVAICGLLALSFRDGRTLVALLATAQIGWGLLALGIGRPLSALAVVVLLATTVLGLGALVAALFAGGMLTAGEEPEGAGPQPFAAPPRALPLVAWILGATALVGAPLFGGFIARQLTSASSLTAAQLTIPLTGLAWVGDALLALALVRATAPALFAKPAIEEGEGEGEGESEALPGASETPLPPVVQPPEPLAGTAQTAPAGMAGAGAGAESVEDESREAEDELGEEDVEGEEYEEEEEEELTPRTPWRERLRAIEPAHLPGVVLALLALVVGIAPGLLFLVGGLSAARAILQPGALDQILQLLPLGYIAGPSEWLPSLVWIAVVILAVLAALIREIARPAPRVVRPLAAATQARLEPASRVIPADLEAGVAPEGEPELEPVAAGVAPLAEPGDVWKDLAGTVDSGWTVPGAPWLLGDLDEDDGEDDGEDEDDVTDEALRALREADLDGAPPRAAQERSESGDDGGIQPAGTRGEGPGEQP
jgi:formate hydrogenlyase subunit 3/multisubunit Na+/H+ antiporter MnhD subunit